MLDPRESWSTQQLVDFLAVVDACEDAGSAQETAVERAAEALEADVGALVEGGAVVASAGFADGEAPAEALVAAASARMGSLTLPWGEACRTLALPLRPGGDARLLLGRTGNDDFAAEEASLLGGMAQVLALSRRRTIELVESLQERLTLLERLACIQHAIVRRAELSEVLEAIVRDVSELVGAEVVALRLVDPEGRAGQPLAVLFSRRRRLQVDQRRARPPRRRRAPPPGGRAAPRGHPVRGRRRAPGGRRVRGRPRDDARGRHENGAPDPRRMRAPVHPAGTHDTGRREHRRGRRRRGA